MAFTAYIDLSIEVPEVVVVTADPNPLTILTDPLSYSPSFTPSSGDYVASDITNDSTVVGVTVADALDTLLATGLDSGDIGVTVQGYGAVLDDLIPLGAPAADGEFIVATGAGAFAYESGATARTSLGLGTIATQNAASVTVVDLTATGTLTIEDIQFNIAYSVPAHTEGLVFWDPDDHTLNGMTDVDGTTIQYGQETVIKIVNGEVDTLVNGEVVYISGTPSGNRPRVLRADADLANAHSTIGVITNTAGILTGQQGYIAIQGVVRGISTSGYTSGDALYLSSTPGAITNIEPTYPAHSIKIGYAQNSTPNGSILVSLVEKQDIGELRGLSALMLTLLADATVADARETLGAQVMHNGFETDLTITWTDGTRTLAITTSDYRVDVEGTQYHKTAGESVVIANTTGLHYVYYNNSGTLVESTTKWDLTATAPVATIYWNATTSTGLCYRADHSTIMDELTHRLADNGDGARYVSGGSISGYTLSLSTDAGIQFALSQTTLYDADLLSTLDNVASAGPYLRLYRYGASGDWTFDVASILPVYYSAGNILQYNELAGGPTWQLTTVADTNRVNYFIVGFPRLGSETDSGLSFGVIAGQAVHTTLESAENETLEDIAGLSALADNFIPLYRLTMQYTAAGGGSSQSEIEAIQDLRGQTSYDILEGSAVDHRNLTNRTYVGSHPASAISVDASAFAGILGATDTDVQTALDTLDNAVEGWSGLTTQYRIPYVNAAGTLIESTYIYTDASGNLILPKTTGVGMQVDPAAGTFGWRDLEGNIRPDPAGAGSPALSAFRGGGVREYAYSATDKIDMNFHIPHDYLEGSDLYIHVHWAHNGATSITGNFQYTLDYTYAKGHDQAIFPAEKTQTITYATVDLATTPQYRHRLEESQLSTSGGSASLLDTDDIEADGLVLVNLTVDAVPTIVGGTPNEPFILTVDLHYQTTNMPTKQRAPDFYV